MAEAAENSGSEEVSLNKRFKFCEEVIAEIESGSSNTKDMQEKLKKCEEELKTITRQISAISLFNKNETVGDIPTSSLQFFLVPSFLATVTQNIIGEPEERPASLDRAQIYLRDFLERLVSYEIIKFSRPWFSILGNSIDQRLRQAPIYDPILQRFEKIKRYKQQKELQENLELIKSQLIRNSDDESFMRELLLTRLRLAANKALDELDNIENERPLAEIMIMASKNELHGESKKPPPKPQKPFIITRNKMQKEVFGLGYPSVPTKTVDEWCEDVVRRGRWNKPEKSDEKEKTDSDDESERAEEIRRKQAQRWDEYKDTHRRGWGNTKNKG